MRDHGRGVLGEQRRARRERPFQRGGARRAVVRVRVGVGERGGARPGANGGLATRVRREQREVTRGVPELHRQGGGHDRSHRAGVRADAGARGGKQAVPRARERGREARRRAARQDGGKRARDAGGAVLTSESYFRMLPLDSTAFRQTR